MPGAQAWIIIIIIIISNAHCILECVRRLLVWIDNPGNFKIVTKLGWHIHVTLSNIQQQQMHKKYQILIGAHILGLDDRTMNNIIIKEIFKRKRIKNHVPVCVVPFQMQTMLCQIKNFFFLSKIKNKNKIKTFVDVCQSGQQTVSANGEYHTFNQILLGVKDGKLYFVTQIDMFMTFGAKSIKNNFSFSISVPCSFTHAVIR